MSKKVQKKLRDVHKRKTSEKQKQKVKTVKPALKKIDKKYIFISLGILLIITFIAFYPSLKNGFVTWDDEDYLHNNLRYIGNLSKQGIAELFNINTVVFGNYHPLTILSYALIYHFYELDPYPFHLYNLVLHLLNVVLVFWFILKISKNSIAVSFVTAILFGVHPLHVESVAWVSETKDVLYTFFFVIFTNVTYITWKFFIITNIFTFFFCG